MEHLTNTLTERLKGAVVLAVVLFAALAISGVLHDTTRAAKAPAMPADYGPYYTLDAY